MNTKRKLMLGVASLGILVILAGVALGIALAAISGNITSGFTITYSARNVNAMISGEYSVTPISCVYFDPGTYSLVGPDKLIPGIDYFSGITFDKNSSSNKSFESVSLEIPAPVLGLNNFVLFRYKIANLDEEDLSLKLSIDGEIDDNIKISYLVTNDSEKDIDSKRQEFENRDDLQEKFSALWDYSSSPMTSLALMLTDGDLNDIKQSKELTEIVVDLVTEFNSMFTFSNTFPLDTTVPPSGYTWEDDLLTALMSGDFKSTTVYIKVAVKDPTVSVKDFSANFKFDLAPAV